MQGKEQRDKGILRVEGMWTRRGEETQKQGREGE